jgi:hypothetical protein
MMAGGYTKQNHNENDQDTNEVIEFAVQELNKRSNAMYPLQLVKVKSVETQVVAGINYRMILEVGGGPENNSHDVEVVVYKHFSGTKELTSHKNA